jgi:hypothetical protein
MHTKSWSFQDDSGNGGWRTGEVLVSGDEPGRKSSRVTFYSFLAPDFYTGAGVRRRVV